MPRGIGPGVGQGFPEVSSLAVALRATPLGRSAPSSGLVKEPRPQLAYASLSVRARCCTSIPGELR